MKVGVNVAINSDTGDIGAFAKKAEDLGFQSLWMAEHPIIPVHTTSKYGGTPDGSIPDSMSDMADPFIGLAIASIITWTIWIAKGFELMGAKRRLRGEIAQLKKSTTLKEASEVSNKEGTLAHTLVHDALEEMRLSANAREKEGIKERVSFRLERLVHASGRTMSSGTGVLATIGSTAPFVGLFGTVWGIMGSFQALSLTQQATLATVAPWIAEALIATAMGLFAAIPAVIFYNRLSNTSSRLLGKYEDFAEEFHAILHRNLQGRDGKPSAG